MNRRHTFVLIALLSSLGGVPIRGADNYHGRTYGYRVDLPEGWIQIPQNSVRKMRDSVLNERARSDIIYDAGFQIESAARWFEYPYVLIQPLPYAQFGLNRQPYEDELPGYVRQITGLDLEELADEHFSRDMRGSVHELHGANPWLETQKHRYLQTIDVDVQGVGPVRCLTVGHFGRHAIVLLHFYSRRSDWDRYSGVREAMLSSFGFDPEYAYSAQGSSAFSWTRFFKSVAFGACAGGVLGFVLSLIIDGMIGRRLSEKTKGGLVFFGALVGYGMARAFVY